jgi:hypothetical protein
MTAPIGAMHGRSSQAMSRMCGTLEPRWRPRHRDRATHAAGRLGAGTAAPIVAAVDDRLFLLSWTGWLVCDLDALLVAENYGVDSIGALMQPAPRNRKSGGKKPSNAS